jgi:phosphate starvation-inducible protein PhoH and related proteins
MARKKNLTANDLDDLMVWEDHSHRTEYKETLDFKNKKIEVKCLNPKQKDLKLSIENNEITIAIGPAGTGKTYLSLITALHLLKSQPQYRKIVLIKSVTTIKGEELGFLPGTLQEKMEPYMWSYLGNLNKIFGDRTTSQRMIDSGMITIEPIAYVRGNTMDNSIVIIDETQNIDIHTFKTIITRIGKNSKMIFLGDIEQIDRRGKDSCLKDVFNKFKEADFVGTIEFEAVECVRNPIIPKVLDILDKKVT